MPRLDGTGPFGQGPMGRGWGPGGAGRPGGFVSGAGRGFGGFCNFLRGWNRPGWGWGGGYVARGSGGAASPQDEAQFLKQEASYLQGELEAIHKRLAELESA